jgi:hypothetical protein
MLGSSSAAFKQRHVPGAVGPGVVGPGVVGKVKCATGEAREPT